MSYSIARVSKVKSSVNTTGIQRHVQRENNNYNNKDIDHEKTGHNYDLIHGQKKQNYKELIEKRIEAGYTGNRKIRSDAIRHVDGIITSDNDFFKDMDLDQVKEYFQDSLEFLENEYGKENMLYATVHTDESTPHMHFGVVPLTEDGRLSAKDIVGNKKALTQFQDRYNEFINAKGYQLERGESKQITEKKHQEMDKFKKGTKYHENVFRQAQEQAERQENKMNELAATLEPRELKYEGRETKTEVKEKLFGKAEITEKETENVVLTPEQYNKVSEQVNAAAAIQKDYNRLKNTDLVKENEKLMKIGQKLLKQNKQLKKENESLQLENKTLKERVRDFKLEIRGFYRGAREFLRESTKGSGSFKKAFSAFYDNIKNKNEQLREKSGLEPKRSEFQKEHKQELDKSKGHSL